MWLTGFDVPCLHTLYVDKPMRGHSLMQAIARVNRVFTEGKEGGLVVDYLGIAQELKHALAEYNRRPKNIDVNETLAWVYYQKGDYAKALPYINEALKTHSKNPVLLCRAGLIYNKTGDKVNAKLNLQQAFKNNANIPEPLKIEGGLALKEI